MKVVKWLDSGKNVSFEQGPDSTKQDSLLGLGMTHVLYLSSSLVAIAWKIYIEDVKWQIILLSFKTDV